MGRRLVAIWRKSYKPWPVEKHPEIFVKEGGVSYNRAYGTFGMGATLMNLVSKCGSFEQKAD